MVTFSKIRSFLAIAAAALLAACGTAGNNAARKPVQTAKPAAVVALALGGGASKGFAHIGIVKVLKENGIPVKVVTGTSAGSIVGSLLASGMSPDRLELEAEILGKTDLVDLTCPPVVLSKAKSCKLHQPKSRRQADSAVSHQICRRCH